MIFLFMQAIFLLVHLVVNGMGITSPARTFRKLGVNETITPFKNDRRPEIIIAIILYTLSNQGNLKV